MDAPQLLQHHVIQHLHAHAQPVHARPSVPLELLQRNRAGVALHSNLGVRSDIVSFARRLQYSSNLPRLQNARRATPEEDRGDRRTLAVVLAREEAAHSTLNVCADRTHERLELVLHVGIRVEVAVDALRLAERHMQIKSDRLTMPIVALFVCCSLCALNYSHI